MQTVVQGRAKNPKNILSHYGLFLPQDLLHHLNILSIYSFSYILSILPIGNAEALSFFIVLSPAPGTLTTTWNVQNTVCYMTEEWCSYSLAREYNLVPPLLHLLNLLYTIKLSFPTILALHSSSLLWYPSVYCWS